MNALTINLLAAILFSTGGTIKWQCPSDVFTSRQVIGFWVWDQDVNTTCEVDGATGRPWAECLDEHAVWLPCHVWMTTDECAPSSPPDDCLPVSVEHWMCPGVHSSIAPVKYFTHLSNIEVTIHVGTKGECSPVPDGTVPIYIIWPLYCEGWTHDDFVACFTQ